MNLLYLKKDALSALKNNLNVNYGLYFTENDNKWIYDQFDENPFVKWKTIPDFKLADLDNGLSPGEIDLENCKIIYKNLQFLTPSQASDERLWAGLAHSVFYGYLRKRWQYDRKNASSPQKDVGSIKIRFFFSGAYRSGYLRNTLARCWWVGYFLYNSQEENPFKNLDILGANDLYSKISEIFRNYLFSSNQNILEGIIQCFAHYKNEHINISVRDHLRPSLQLLNALGGSIVLDALSSQDICDILVDNIDSIRQGNEKSIVITNDDFEEMDEESITGLNNEENVRLIKIGDTVSVNPLQNKAPTRNDFYVRYIDYKGKKLIPPVSKELLNKKIGDIIEIEGYKYEITKITDS